MPKVTLTELGVRHLKVVPGKNVIYLDKNGPTGFGVRVTKNGARSYVLTYGSERRRVTLGTVSETPLRTAREKARALLTGSEVPETPTLADALRQFLTVHCGQRNRPSTARETERLLSRHLVSRFGSRPVAELGTTDLAAVLDGLLSTPSEANHLFTATKTFFNFCLGRGYVERNPLQALKRPARAIARSRVLSDHEVQVMWLFGANFGQYGAIVRLLLLSGQRLAQIANLRAEMIGQDRITWPASLMKGGEEHSIPLTPLVQSILVTRPREGLLFHTEGNPLVPFNNWSNSHRVLLRETGLAHFTRHDLRRTTATLLARLRVAPHIIEQLIAHRSGVISGVSAIYNRFEYFEEQRDALLRLERFIATLVASGG